mgnify:CR=1 FL=1
MSEVIARMPKIFQPLDIPHRYKVMYGGRGSAKSWAVAKKLLIKGATGPVRVLCTRELQKSIKESVHKLLKDQRETLGRKSVYDVNDTSIKWKNGTEFIFMGVKFNSDEIKSTEGIDVC